MCVCVCVCGCVRAHRRVDEAVKFPGLPPRRQLTYQAKQTISREMEQEKMRRAEQLMLLRNPVAVRPMLLHLFTTLLHAKTTKVMIREKNDSLKFCG